MNPDELSVEPRTSRRLVPVAFILAGLAALYDTSRMADPDSWIFPRAVALAMVLLAGVQLVIELRQPAAGPARARPRESTIRRVGVLLTLLAATLAMPWLGFLAPAIMAFVALAALAMHEPWSGRRRAVYPLVGLLLVMGLYWLFSRVLEVPLPRNPW